MIFFLINLINLLTNLLFLLILLYVVLSYVVPPYNQFRLWVDRIVEEGYVDTFRALHPDKIEAYTWWSYQSRARDRNVGWRIDYFFVTPDLRDRIAAAEIHADVMGSDHRPVSLTLK